MIARWIGAVFVVLGCGGVGFTMASRCRKEIRALSELMTALQIMHSELSCRMLPLPELFSRASEGTDGCVKLILRQLGEEMERQVSPDAFCCMQVVLNRNRDLPDSVREVFQALGRSMGNFDLDGQLRQMEAVQADCKRILDIRNEQKEDRIRQYQTLGICAGAALAILLL